MKEEIKILRAFVMDLAEGDCSYGDGCPEFAGTRHGTCIVCKARNTLSAADKVADDHDRVTNLVHKDFHEQVVAGLNEELDALKKDARLTAFCVASGNSLAAVEAANRILELTKEV